MIRLFSLFMVISYASLTYSQVGINTINPQATLDIVTKGATSATQALSVINSVDKNILTIDDRGYVGLGVTNPKIRLDLRDGSNNSIIGIGSSSKTASLAQKGALKYDSISESLFYSDGSTWNQINSRIIRLYVVANISDVSELFPNNATTTIAKWNKTQDLLDVFDASTGIFTTPRDGIYTISVVATFDNGPVASNSYMQLELSSSTTTIKCQSSYDDAADFQTSVLCSGSFKLSKGETLKSVITHNLGETKKLKAGYCNLSILEN